MEEGSVHMVVGIGAGLMDMEAVVLEVDTD